MTITKYQNKASTGAQDARDDTHTGRVIYNVIVTISLIPQHDANSYTGNFTSHQGGCGSNAFGALCGPSNSQIISLIIIFISYFKGKGPHKGL